MPNLPTLTLTQPQIDRCLVVFGSAANYKTWLIGAIRAEVTAHELDAIVPQQAAERSAIAADVATIVPS